MNIIDSIDRTLEEWGQNLRGGASVPTHGLQPRDILRQILAALEDNRVEGLDHKIYAPNVFNVRLNLDEEEHSRLMPFLSHEELEASVQRYCQEHKYNFRGALEVRVLEGINAMEAAPAPAPTQGQASLHNKVHVQSRYKVLDASESGDANLNSEVRLYTPQVEETEHSAGRTDLPAQ